MIFFLCENKVRRNGRKITHDLMANKRQTCVHMYMPQLWQECSSPVRTSSLVSECGLKLRNG